MAETITGLKRTHYCGTLRPSDIGKEAVVFGWVQRQRDLGQLIFIDLRDRTGIVQLAFDEGTSRDIFQKAFAVLTKGRTVVMIAHRLSTVVGADKIVVLQEGRAVEQGTHEQLVAANGLYARMWADYNRAVQWKISSEKEAE